MENYEPCSICEEYIEGVICDKDKCPVGKMKAENKRLKCQVNRLNRYDEERDIRLHARLTESARAEAVKEIIERIKEKLRDHAKIDFQGQYYYLIGIPFFDNIIEEMVGEG